MKKILPIFLLPFLGMAQAPANYYNGTENLTGYALKHKLHEILSDKVISWHYNDLKTHYGVTDIDRYYENNGTLLDIYSEKPYGPDNYEYTLDNIIGTASQEGQGWNREHVMPQSTFYSNYPMYSDLYFVIPTDARINQLRSNNPYGVGNATTHHQFSNGSRISNSGIPNSPYTGRVFEPIDEFKGDIARMLLYFIVRYEGKLGTFKFNTTTNPATDVNPLNGTNELGYEKWYIDMLKSWHQLDPVSQKEIDRNNYVFELQKNRNPFVDHPEWVDLIWKYQPDGVAPNTVSNLAATRVASHFVDLTWNASQNEDVIGYAIYENGVLKAKSNTNSITIDKLNASTSYSYNVVAYDTGYIESAPSNTISVTTQASDSHAKNLLITKYIEGSSNNKALEITNLTGHDVNLEGYQIAIQFRSGSNYYTGDILELDGVVKANEKFVVLHADWNLSCFSSQNAKFISASPSLTFSGYNYVEINYNGTTVDAVGVKGIDNGNGNKSLYRLASVQHPTANYSAAEWQEFSTNYCTGLTNGSFATSELSSKKLAIYPNPVVDFITIEGKIENKTIELFDASGRLLNQQKLVSNKVDVRFLPKGVYFLSVDGILQKFIK